MHENKTERQSFSATNPATILSIRTPVQTVQKMRDKAQADGKSLNKIINEALETYVQETAR